MKNKEELEEMRQDMLLEARQDEEYEYRMRTDIEFFSDQHQEDIEEYSKLYNKLHKALKQYDWHNYEVDDLRL